MNVLFDVQTRSLDSLQELREEYLQACAFAQDAFLEALVQNAQVFVLERKGHNLGYCALTQDKVLVEFHLTEAAIYLAQSVFPKLVEKLQIRKALIKSFDFLALSNCLDLARTTSVAGMLVRKYVPQPLPQLPHIAYTTRKARPSDLPSVLALDQDVFTHPERMSSVIEQGQMLLFEKQERLVGFGILRPVIAGRNDVEVGIAIDPSFRNRGYAAYVLRDLVEYCIKQGHNPVSGCSIDNLASIRLGQRIGLCARHRLVEIEF